MTDIRPLDRLLDRADVAGVQLTTDHAQQLLAYYELLQRWNRTINLTALKLDGYPAATIDRIIIEPIVSKGLIGFISGLWLDLGSGNGSPAIPLKILSPDAELTMVESRSRKAAFLREVVRHFEFRDVSVLTRRIEDLVEVVARGSIQLLTVRGVRLTDQLLEVGSLLLAEGGKLVIFGAVEPPTFDSFPLRHQQTLRLPAASAGVHLFLRERSV